MKAVQRLFIMAIMATVMAVMIIGSVGVYAQSSTGQVKTGEVRGRVRLAGNGDPVHNVKVTIIQLQISTETEKDGTYVFRNVPSGKYDISAMLER